MNGSQLLYKISGLQYSIRMKKTEYNNAVTANDQFKMDLYKADLAILKADLDKAVKALETIPTNIAADVDKGIKTKGKWQSFFTLSTLFNKK